MKANNLLKPQPEQGQAEPDPTPVPVARRAEHESLSSVGGSPPVGGNAAQEFMEQNPAEFAKIVEDPEAFAKFVEKYERAG